MLHRTEQVVVEHLLTKTPTSVKTEYLVTEADQLLTAN